MPASVFAPTACIRLMLPINSRNFPKGNSGTSYSCFARMILFMAYSDIAIVIGLVPFGP